jgi:hypothetical protein
MESPIHTSEKASHATKPHAGVKYALLIGINYFNTPNELAGCLDDIIDVKAFLLTRGFAEQNMVVMMDSPSTDKPVDASFPTRENIISAMKLAAKRTVAGDTLYIHYSGHGSTETDRNGDEKDGNDECICPVDCDVAGMLIDDLMYDILVKNLPAGVKLRAVFDSCHSGSCLDLPVRYSELGKVERENYTSAPADVIFISGCKDKQTSADSSFNGRPNGAMTWAFLAAMKSLGRVTPPWTDFCGTLRQLLKKNGYSQIPQLCAETSSAFTRSVDL